MEDKMKKQIVIGLLAVSMVAGSIPVFSQELEYIDRDRNGYRCAKPMRKNRQNFFS